MFWLAIAGLIIAGVGAAVAGGGAVLEGYQESERLELEAKKLRESQAVMREQLGAQQAGLAAIGSVAELRQRELSLQALGTAREGRAARGGVAAAAGAGNLGGASPLRQSMEIQRRMQEQLGVISGRRRELEIQTGVETLAAEAGIAGTEYDIRWAGLEARQKEKEADWAITYGWLSGAGTLLTGAGQAMAGAAGMKKG